MDRVWIRRPIWCTLAVVGLAAVLATSALPWRDQEFQLSLASRLAIALAGAALLIAVATRPRGAGGRVVTLTGLLGLSLLAYPMQLSLAAADLDLPLLGPIIQTAGAAGHILPLGLVQLVPMLASGVITGRPLRAWQLALVATLVATTAATGLSLAGAPYASALALAGTLGWHCSFVLSPLATWTSTRGMIGEVRLRVIVAALAATVPVLIIAWCLGLGVLAESLGWSGTTAVEALMAGFALGCLSGGCLTLASLGPAENPLLRARSIRVVLDAVVALLLGILACVAGALSLRLRPAAPFALLVGAVLAVAAASAWQRWRGVVGQMVDPSAELRAELASIEPVPDGDYRVAAAQAVRRIVGDQALDLHYDPPAPVASDVVLAVGSDGRATITATPGSQAARARVRRLGDCAHTLRRALLEDRVARAEERAGRAAAEERSRLSQNLHDGLQSRLLGLALNLQLSAREIGDPSAALVVGETVESLRALVEDVRALGGGRLPALLVDEGLGPALTALLGPWAPMLTMRLPVLRMPQRVEETAYFVIGEAVTNALRHAAAGHIDVMVSDLTDGTVRVTVRDDGRGGADPRLGSGLRGIGERVAAAGGVIAVADAEPRGTLVEAVLPCG